MNVVSRAAIFLKVEDTFREYAEKDIEALKNELQKFAPHLDITTKVVKLPPKSFVTSYAQREGFDLVITGTKGLSSLKEMTVGSVTAYIMDHAQIPVLAIPENWEYRGLNHILLGIDEDSENARTLAPLVRLAEAANAQLEVVHTTQAMTVPLDFHPGSSIPLGELNYTFSTIPEGKSIPEALTNYGLDREVDLMVMVHRKRGFIERVFTNSYAREELFLIKTPLLILPQV
jgi:nucleotide-binding universal stress UspA family protein